MMKQSIPWILAVGALATVLSGCGGGDDTASGAAVPVAPAPAVQPASSAAEPAPPAQAGRPVIEQVLAYGEGAKRNLEGYLAMPQDAAEPLPGVLVIHESWGLNDDIRAMARDFAAEGYVVLAVDLYDGATAQTAESAQRLLTDVYAEPDAARSNLKQAYDYLDKYAFAPRIAAVGLDSGAGWALQTGLLFPETLDALVLYYGQVSTNRDDLAKLKMPILGFFAGEDQSVPVRHVQDFRSLLMDLGKAAEVFIVPGVQHAYVHPTGRTYDEKAAHETRLKTLEFLRRQLRLDTPAVQ